METEKSTLRETVDRGVSVIPFYTYNHLWSNYTLYLHWHNEFEIIYVEEGSVVYTIDTVPIKVSQGQCIIINCGQLHSAHSEDNKICRHSVLLFDLNFLNSAGSDVCQSSYLTPMIKGTYRLPMIIDETSNWGQSVIKEVKEALEISSEKSFGWELGIKASLYKIISILARENKFLINENTTVSALNNKIDVIKRSINYIQNNYTKRIYIEDLAEEVNMNPQYFCRFFKTNTGKTPVDFINQYRIEEASKLLQTEDKKISDICYETGFDNFSYFIKKFKKYKGSTPYKYKKSTLL